jgi:hypothetical protein
MYNCCRVQEGDRIKSASTSLSKMSLVSSAGHSLLRIADLRVDPTLDEICKDGHTIKLEPKAMQLLIWSGRTWS